MSKKCKSIGCFRDGLCSDGRCIRCTRANRGIGRYSSRSFPRTPERHLGIEIECFGRTGEAFKGMCAQRIRGCEDGSLPSYGAEFKICQPSSKIVGIVERFVERLRALGARVNGQCGLHVHIDARGIPDSRKRDFIRWLQKYETAWFQLIPASRRNSHFCANIDPHYSSHYQWANLTSYNTVEIRLHPGSLNRHKIGAWLRAMICLQDVLYLNSTIPFPELAREGMFSPSSFFGLFDRDPLAREYIRCRYDRDGVLENYQSTDDDDM